MAKSTYLVFFLHIPVLMLQVVVPWSLLGYSSFCRNLYELFEGRMTELVVPLESDGDRDIQSTNVWYLFLILQRVRIQEPSNCFSEDTLRHWRMAVTALSFDLSLLIKTVIWLQCTQSPHLAAAIFAVSDKQDKCAWYQKLHWATVVIWATFYASDTELKMTIARMRWIRQYAQLSRQESEIAMDDKSMHRLRSRLATLDDVPLQLAAQ